MAFSLEIIMLIVAVYGPIKIINTPWLRYAVAAGLLLLIIVAWSLWAAPTATGRLKLPYIVIFKFLIYLIPTYLLFKVGMKHYAWMFYALVVITEVAAVLFNEYTGAVK
ncbi:YrdB family protein [Chitinophaga varians]|uniref:YrdB family protein n=1 Tax=Chitinophaga varians TaxID=2202339 RepID=UPI00166005A7|nr:YrdB family protein [Chitinophaga varians]MBC9909333.1 YrdB family protein [Chitinophaga varians]